MDNWNTKLVSANCVTNVSAKKIEFMTSSNGFLFRPFLKFSRIDLCWTNTFEFSLFVQENIPSLLVYALAGKNCVRLPMTAPTSCSFGRSWRVTRPKPATPVSGLRLPPWLKLLPRHSHSKHQIFSFYSHTPLHELRGLLDAVWPHRFWGRAGIAGFGHLRRFDAKRRWPTCLLGGCLGLRPRPPPSCVKLADAAEAWGPFRPLAPDFQGGWAFVSVEAKMPSFLSDQAFSGWTGCPRSWGRQYRFLPLNSKKEKQVKILWFRCIWI